MKYNCDLSTFGTRSSSAEWLKRAAFSLCCLQNSEAVQCIALWWNRRCWLTNWVLKAIQMYRMLHSFGVLWQNHTISKARLPRGETLRDVKMSWLHQPKISPNFSNQEMKNLHKIALTRILTIEDHLQEVNQGSQLNQRMKGQIVNFKTVITRALQNCQNFKSRIACMKNQFKRSLP